MSEDFIRKFGDVAAKRGEPWRLSEPELMDAYQAATESPPTVWQVESLEQQIEAAREFVKRHPALTLIDLAEFEAFLKVPAAMEAVLASENTDQ